MALDEHAQVERDMQFRGYLRDSFRFGLPTSVGEEYEWYILGLEEFEGIGGARDRVMGSKEDAINTVLVLVLLVQKEKEEGERSTQRRMQSPVFAVERLMFEGIGEGFADRGWLSRAE
jgi:hypothetical protein